MESNQCTTCGVKVEASPAWATVLCTNFCAKSVHNSSDACMKDFINSKIGINELKIVENGGIASLDNAGLNKLTVHMKCDCGAPYYKFRWNNYEATANIDEWSDFDDFVVYKIKYTLGLTMDNIINKVVPRPPVKWSYIDSAVQSLRNIGLVQLERPIQAALEDTKIIPTAVWRRLPVILRHFVPQNIGLSETVARLGYLIDIKKNRIAVAKRICELVDPEISKYVVERGN